MCELLIKAADTTHSDPEKDQRGCYKRGYIVDIRPDGFGWGADERLPYFYLIKIPGVTVDRAMSFGYMDKEMSILDPAQTVRRRRYAIRVGAIPPAARQKLQDTGTLEISPSGDYTRAQLIAFIRDQKTGLDETRVL